MKDRWEWASWICFKLDLAFKHFSYWLLENEIFENFFAKSAKEVGEGASENSGNNPLSQTTYICGWPLTQTYQPHTYRCSFPKTCEVRAQKLIHNTNSMFFSKPQFIQHFLFLVFETLLCFLLCFTNYLTQIAPFFFFSVFFKCLFVTFHTLHFTLFTSTSILFRSSFWF